MVEPDGTAHGLGNLPAGLPNTDAVDAARRAGSDLRTQQVAGVPVRIFTEADPGRSDPALAVQVVADITNEVRTVTTLVSILVVGGLLIMRRLARAGLVLRGAGPRPDPRLAPAPAGVRRGREP